GSPLGYESSDTRATNRSTRYVTKQHRSRTGLSGACSAATRAIASSFTPTWPPKSRFSINSGRSRPDVRTEPIDRRLHATAAVRNTEGVETRLDHAECAEHHGSIDVAHVGDAEGLA